MQVLYLGELGVWQWDTELYPLRSEEETEMATLDVDFTRADLKLLRQIDHCLLNGLDPSVRCHDAEVNLSRAEDRLRKRFGTLADERAALMGITLEKFDVPKMKVAYKTAADGIADIARLAKLALVDACQCYKIGGAQSGTANCDKARASWMGASYQLQQYAGSHAGQVNLVNIKSLAHGKWVSLLLGWSALNLVVMVVCSFAFLRSIRSRLRIVLDNNERFRSDRPLNLPVSGSDEIAQLDASFHEMTTEIGRSRHEQTAIIENAQDLICSTSAEGKITAINRTCESWFGLSAKELIGRWLMDFIEADSQQHTAERLLAVASGEEQLTFETKVLDKDGLPIDLLCSAVWSEEDQTAFCVLHDLRHQKMAERLQREVIEVACQELKNPIVAISDFHSGLSDGRFGQLKPGTQGKIESAKRCTGRMLTLVKDLEDCENLDRGKLHLEPVWSSLGDIFDRTMSAIADLAASGQVNLVAEPTALQIYADPARLLQILVNLSSNAVKFSPKQGTITLSAQALPGLVTIMVKDQGRGVPESMINSIFERFCQVRQSDSKAMGGSGLGLAICKSLVELHGGTIRVESGVNEGSIFSFTIPSPSRSAPPNITSGG